MLIIDLIEESGDIIPSWYAAAHFEGDAMTDTPRVRDGWKAWYEAWQVEETARDHTHRKR